MPATGKVNTHSFFHGVFMNLNITTAFDTAAKSHGQQTRKYDGSSYTVHLNEVFNLLAYAGVEDEQVLFAGILYDTLEDSSLTAKDIETQFGNNVLSIVLSLTDDKSLSLASRKALAIEKAKTLPAAALTIKLAALISNMSAIPGSWHTNKIAVYIDHCRAVLNAVQQNPRANSVSQNLVALADFFYKGQTSGCQEYSNLCELAEQGLLYWNEDGLHFVIANHLESSNEASKLASRTIAEAFHLELLRGLTVSNVLPKMMSLTWEQFSGSDEPLIYGTASRVQCQRVLLKTS